MEELYDKKKLFNKQEKQITCIFAVIGLLLAIIQIIKFDVTKLVSGDGKDQEPALGRNITKWV